MLTIAWSGQERKQKFRKTKQPHHQWWAKASHTCLHDGRVSVLYLFPSDRPLADLPCLTSSGDGESAVRLASLLQESNNCRHLSWTDLVNNRLLKISPVFSSFSQRRQVLGNCSRIERLGGESQAALGEPDCGLCLLNPAPPIAHTVTLLVVQKEAKGRRASISSLLTEMFTIPRYFAGLPSDLAVEPESVFCLVCITDLGRVSLFPSFKYTVFPNN